MASNGLAWALSMLGLDVVELLALIEIVFGEPSRNPAFKPNVIISIYFWIAVVSLMLQIVGTVLVTKGRYREGGIIQIVSNVVHLPKGDGLIGLIGGIKAYKYPEALAAQQAATAKHAAVVA